RLFEYQNPHLLQQQVDRKIDALTHQLLNGEQDTIDEVMSHPQLTDRQNFLQLVRNAQKEHQKNVDDTPSSTQLIINDLETTTAKAPEGKQTKKLKKLLRELFKQ